MNRYDLCALLVVLFGLLACQVGLILLHKYAGCAGNVFVVLAAFWLGVGYRSLRYRAWIERVRNHNKIKEPDESKLY